MRAFDGQAQLVRQHARLPAMIEMTVRDEDFLQRHAGFRDARLELVQIAARIDQRGLHRLGAPDQRAVLLQRRNRQDCGLHRRRRLGSVIHGCGCGGRRRGLQEIFNVR